MTIELAVRIDGSDDAPPLVLLNSVGSSTAMWEPCLAPLIEQFRVIRIDHRGHGDSSASPAGASCSIAELAGEVLAALDRVGVERFHVAGLSLGGMIAMWIATHHPARVARLALLCTAARMPAPQAFADRAAQVREAGMEPVADAVVVRWLTPALAERDPDLLAGMRSMLTDVDPESYAQCCDAIAAMDQRPDLGRIASPTLVIAGEQDPATPPDSLREIAEAVPGARLEVLDPAAHLATYERPGAVAALLLEHFGAGATITDGFRVRREVLGDRYVDAALDASTDLTLGFQQFLTRYAWGGVWTRPQLARRERSIATLAALVTLGAEHELAAHVRGAITNGLTPAEVIEVIQHVSIYAGIPRGNRAVVIARDTLTALNREDPA